MMNFLMKSYLDSGLLLMRLGLGILFICHGFPKVMGGTELWGKLGMAMGNFGITSVPVLWGFMAALSEFGGGLSLLLGLFTRLGSFLLASTMCVATFHHYFKGDDFLHVTSRPLELMFVFLGIMLIGGGRYSLDAKLWKN
ncbi:MAG: putative oxidoreductase [Halioglobus sp.]|jgi:putative oxidoreductase